MTRERIGRRLIQILIGALVALAVLYLTASYVVVSASLAPGSRCPVWMPPDGLPAEPVNLTTADGISLSGWFVPSRGQRAIIHIHGLNDRVWNSSQTDTAKHFVAAGFDVLVFDLRAHGDSDGDLLGLGWHERQDVRAAVDFLLSRGFKPGTIGVHGGSYGAAVALLAAAVAPEIGAVVANSSFADMRDVMDEQIETKIGVPSWFTKSILRPGLAGAANSVFDLDLEEIPPERAVPDIAPRPILFIHGRKDTVIPVDHAHRLKDASQNSGDELWIHNGGHTSGVRMPGSACEVTEVSPMREVFLERVTAFFDRTLSYSEPNSSRIEHRQRRERQVAGYSIYRWIAAWEEKLKEIAVSRARVASGG